MIQDGARIAPVIIALNSDAWLIRKKGYAFMPWEERKEILLGLSAVDDVVEVDDTDGTVCEVLRRLQPEYFGNGGDRKNNNTPEIDVCKELGIELVWNLGGEKIQSSSELVAQAGDYPMPGVNYPHEL